MGRRRVAAHPDVVDAGRRSGSGPQLSPASSQTSGFSRRSGYDRSASAPSMGQQSPGGRSCSSYGTPPAGWLNSKADPPPLRSGARSPEYIGASCDEKRARCKKHGYNQPAAQSSMPNLLVMPPQRTQEVKQIDPYTSRGPRAGLKTADLTKILRCDTMTSSTRTAGRQRPTDPITHQTFDIQIIDNEQAKGAAGVNSTRLTNLNADWAEIPRGPSHGGFHPPARTDVISHPPGGRRPSTSEKSGIRHFDEKGRSEVPLDHADKQRAVPLSPKQIRAKGGTRRQKEIPIAGGKIHYNLGGFGDLLPAATEEFFKADRPASRAHRIDNDKKTLPNFVTGRVPYQEESSYNQESPGMRDLMYGRAMTHR